MISAIVHKQTAKNSKILCFEKQNSHSLFHHEIMQSNSFQGGNKTISIVTLTVAPENNDAELVCRASNPWFPSDIIEDKRIINVACE